MAINCTFRVRRVGAVAPRVPFQKVQFSHGEIGLVRRILRYVTALSTNVGTSYVMSSSQAPLPSQYKSPPRYNRPRYSVKFSCSNSKGYQSRTQLITYHRFVGVNPCDDGLEPLVLLPLPEV